MATCDTCGVRGTCRITRYRSNGTLGLWAPPPGYWSNGRHSGCVEVPTVALRQEVDAKCEDEMRKYSMQDALALAPMADCTLPHMSTSREWWRYGWAWGFLGRSILDAVVSVREKRYRDAARIGYTVGVKARSELEAGDSCA